MMKAQFAIALLLTAGVTYGQRGNDDTGEAMALQREFYLKMAKSVKVEIECPLGELDIRSQQQGPLAVLDLKNSLQNFEYRVTYTESNQKGELKVGGSGEGSVGMEFKSISDYKKLFGIGESMERENRWRVMLKEADDLPYDLDFEIGLGDADVELGRMAIEQLKFNCGLSDATLELKAPNPVRMRRLEVDNGMGAFEGVMLGNANFEDMKVSVGMGAATLDLRGKYTGDADIKVDVGMGSITLKVPADMDIRVNVNASPFSSISLEGLNQEGKTTYRSKNYGSGRHTLDFNINVGMGSVEMELVDDTR
ncbi:MAG: cell wall-active antibiotics response protein [Candidatus Marinimicrobia bacterium]|nr:cell wall-active antibiotics response protein [Candidatus Neomarinimicrobiota bacterium]